MKIPLLCLFGTLFGQFLGTFPNRPILMMPWLSNWIIFWIESAEFILNWIIFWNGSLVKQYWIEYWMNRFLAKFKHWIESDLVLATTATISNQLSPQVGWASVMTMTEFHLVSLKQGGACSVFYQGIFPKDFDARMEALVAILKLAAVGAMRGHQRLAKSWTFLKN